MRVLDEFNCQYCGKKVIMETENEEIDIDRYEVDYACVECYNKISTPIMEHNSIIESEWYEIQGSYF